MAAILNLIKSQYFWTVWDNQAKFGIQTQLNTRIRPDFEFSQRMWSGSLEMFVVGRFGIKWISGGQIRVSTINIIISNDIAIIANCIKNVYKNV